MKLAMVVVMAACTSDFSYTATVQAEDPSITAVSLDDIDGRGGYVELHTSYPSLAAATASTHHVSVTRPVGTQDFELVPTRCGGGCDDGYSDCSSVEGETDHWFVSLQAGDLELSVTGGICDRDGQALPWSY